MSNFNKIIGVVGGIVIVFFTILMVNKQIIVNIPPIEIPPFNAPSYGSSQPDISSPYFSVGGVRVWKARAGLTTSTTTVCAIQSPIATSTLLSASVVFKKSSTTASTITMAKSATAYATTTPINTLELSANAQGFLIASTSPIIAGTNPKTVFEPSQWIVVGMQGGIGTFSPIGQCQATWEQIVE
ncbi:MAG: hypothetical protein WC724_03800 [Candidatus Paceibacterota bacterium]|jgi:hypothetical protein